MNIDVGNLVYQSKQEKSSEGSNLRGTVFFKKSKKDERTTSSNTEQYGKNFVSCSLSQSISN